jgi:cell division protein FtsB
VPTQRRMPSGQGPARRSGPGGRGGSGVRAGGRASGRPAVGAGGRAPAGGAGGRAEAREGSRPALARRTGAGAAERTPAPVPRRLTGRATVLFVVLAALALGYAYPVRVYLSQQAEIHRMESGQAAQRQHIADLEAEVGKWQDDAYVVAQARRLYWFYPGEIPLVVLWDSDGAARDAGVKPKPPAQPTPDPWYGKLWSSVEVANR